MQLQSRINNPQTSAKNKNNNINIHQRGIISNNTKMMMMNLTPKIKIKHFKFLMELEESNDLKSRLLC